MALTPVLGITQVSANQSNKEATINDAILALEGAGNATYTLDYSLVGTGIATLDEVTFSRNFLFKAISAASDLTAISLQVPRTLNDNPIQRIFVCYNDSGEPLTLKIAGAAAGSSGATGLILPNGSSRLIAMDGDNLIIASQATTVSRFIDLVDVPGAYTGKGGLTFRVKSDESGLEFAEGITVEGLADVDTTTNPLADGMFLRYNGTKKEWQSTAINLISTFLGLSDTPDSYAGLAGYLVHINAQTSALEFVNPASLGGPVTGGGNTGQVLTKKSSTDGDYDWETPAVALPTGGIAGQWLKKNSATDGDASWNNLPIDIPAGGSSGSVLTKTSASDYDVEWTSFAELSAEYTGAVVNSCAFSLIDGDTLPLPFTPTEGNALVVAYFSSTAPVVLAGWSTLKTLGAAAAGWWGGAVVAARIVQTGDSLTIEPVTPSNADAAVVFEIDVRYFKGDFTKIAPTLAYLDSSVPAQTPTNAEMILVATAHRAGAHAVWTVGGAPYDSVPTHDSSAGGNRFADGIYFQPADAGTDITMAYNMGTGGTTGVYMTIAFNAITSAVEEAPQDGNSYLRNNKQWMVQGPTLPTGGTAGQLLTKNSTTNGDASWKDAPAAPEPLPTGGTQGQILTKNSATDGDASWENPATVTVLGGPVVIQSMVHDSSTTDAVTLPAAPTVGNWLVAFLFTNGAAPAVNTAEGWELIGTRPAGANFQDAVIFAKKVVTGDTATVTPSTSGTGDAGDVTVFELSKAAIGSDITKVITASNTTLSVSSGTVGPIAISGASSFLFAVSDRAGTPILTPSITGSVPVTITGVNDGNRYGAAFSYDALADGASLSIGVNLNGGTEGAGAYAYLLFNPLNASFVGEAPNDGNAYVRKSKAWALQTASATALSALTDVDTTTTAPTDGQALVWNAAASKWEPGSVAPEDTGSGTNNSSGSNGSTFVVEGTGTGASQAITLPVAGMTVDDVLVFVNGIRFATTEYTIAGSTLTLTTNASGDTIEVLRSSFRPQIRVSAFATTTPNVSEVLSMFVVDQPITFSANFAGSIGKCLTKPTSSFTMTVSVDTNAIGTIIVGTDGTFTFTTTGGAAQQVAAGSIIQIIAPGSTDATIANLAATLVATLN